MGKKLVDIASEQINRFSIRVVYEFYNSFVIDICFLMSNILLVACILFVKLSFQTLILYLIPIYLFGPALSTVLLSISDLKKDNNSGKITIRKYFKSYRSQFKASSKLSVVYAGIIIVGIVDAQLLLKYDAVKSLSVPIIITGLYLLSSMFFAHRIRLINKHISVWSVIWQAFLFSYRNVFSTLAVGVVLLLLVIFTVINPAVSIFLLFGFSVIVIAKIIDKRIFVGDKREQLRHKNHI